MKLTFHEAALKEVQEAHSWYAERSETAPGRMLQELDAAIQHITRDPESRPIIAMRFRWVKLTRFPYVVVYQMVAEDWIKVIAFAHTSRRPDYWRGRE